MYNPFAFMKNRIVFHHKEEEGAISVMNVFLMITLAIFTGLAVDTASLISARTQLQSAADTAAHAAMYTRIDNDTATARAEAIKIARANMPTSVYGDVLRAENIHFGSYDSATKTFTIDETSTEAVLVETDRLAENANPVSSFMLQFIGFWEWDVRTEAVFTRPNLPCSGEGFYANGRVDMQSQNGFYNNFCIHSDARVEFNQGNFFDAADGVRVSVPSFSQLILPGGDYSGNTGLMEARREGGPYNFDVSGYIDAIIAGIQNPASDHWQPYINNGTIIDVTPGSGGGGVSGTGTDDASLQSTEPETIMIAALDIQPCRDGVRCKSNKNNGNGNGNSGNTGDTGDTGDTGNTGNGNGNSGNGSSGNGGGNSSGLSMADLTEGSIHRVSCSGGNLDVAAETFKNVVVITDCTFSFSNGSALEDATFITLSTDDTTIKAPQGLRIGKNDNCTAGGGAALISKGGMKTAAKLQLYGGQIVVAKDLTFAAQGNGFGGVSVIAGGEIDGTSKSTMGLCNGGLDEFYEAKRRPRMSL